MTGRVIPFPSRAPEPPEPDNEHGFEELTRVGDQAEALVVRGLLEAHGIEVLLRSHVAPSVYPFSVGEQGAVQVLVRREALATSRLLLARASRARPLPSGSPSASAGSREGSSGFPVRPVRQRLDWPRLALAALVVLHVFLAGPRAALAHARLVRSTPANQARLAAPPEQVELWFSELLEDGFNSVEVVQAAELTATPRTNLARDALARGAPVVDRDDRTHMTVPVQELGPGDYVVEWRVLSRDGHSAAGRFTFRVQAAR